MSGQILLLSGGLDSFAIWRILGKPRAVYMDIKNKASARERDCVMRIMRDFPSSDITIRTGLGLRKHEQQDGFIPYRNLFMILLASLMPVCNEIIIGQVNEWQVDKNKKFYRLMEKIISDHAQKKVRVHAPFAGHTKSQLVEKYLTIGSAEELKKYSYSCRKGGKIHCGNCTNCLRRYMAFKNNEIIEPMKRTPTMKDFVDKWRNPERKPSVDRTIQYFKRFFEARRAFK